MNMSMTKGLTVIYVRMTRYWNTVPQTKADIVNINPTQGTAKHVLFWIDARNPGIIKKW